MHRIRLILYGGVQGVGFRAFTRHAAHTTGIRAGWVRNRPDGAVELEAEGEPDALGNFRSLVSRGPGYADVQRIEEQRPSTESLPSPFAIVR